MADKRFPNGLFAKAPHENAPDFVKAALSIKKADLLNWLQSESPKPNGKGEEWINLQVNEGRSGKWYCAVDDWQPEQQKQQPTDDDDFDDDIPF
tara:strand:+ start:1103 stop:1384 length:282 start_codon:yes stop_codon:yes gene_type:complete